MLEEELTALVQYIDDFSSEELADQEEILQAIKNVAPVGLEGNISIVGSTSVQPLMEAIAEAYENITQVFKSILQLQVQVQELQLRLMGQQILGWLHEN